MQNSEATKKNKYHNILVKRDQNGVYIQQKLGPGLKANIQQIWHTNIMAKISRKIQISGKTKLITFSRPTKKYRGNIKTKSCAPTRHTYELFFFVPYCPALCLFTVYPSFWLVTPWHTVGLSFFRGKVQRDFRPPVFFLISTSLGH